MKIFSFALAIAVCASLVSVQHAKADVIADLFGDFQTGTPAGSIFGIPME